MKPVDLGSTAALLAFWTSRLFLAAAVMWNVGRDIAFLASTHRMPVPPPSGHGHRKCLQALPNVLGKVDSNRPQFVLEPQLQTFEKKCQGNVSNNTSYLCQLKAIFLYFTLFYKFLFPSSPPQKKNYKESLCYDFSCKLCSRQLVAVPIGKQCLSRQQITVLPAPRGMCYMNMSVSSLWPNRMKNEATSEKQPVAGRLTLELT